MSTKRDRSAATGLGENMIENKRKMRGRESARARERWRERARDGESQRARARERERGNRESDGESEEESEGERWCWRTTRQGSPPATNHLPGCPSCRCHCAGVRGGGVRRPGRQCPHRRYIPSAARGTAPPARRLAQRDSERDAVTGALRGVAVREAVAVLDGWARATLSEGARHIKREDRTGASRVRRSGWVHAQHIATRR